ncbi:hypothetical protein [Vulcanisaeta souniana]
MLQEAYSRGFFNYSRSTKLK